MNFNNKLYEDFLSEFEEVENDNKKYSKQDLADFEAEMKAMELEELKDVEFEKPIENLEQIQNSYIKQQLNDNHNEEITKTDVNDITQSITELGMLKNQKSRKIDPLKEEREAKEKFLAAIRNKG